MRLDTRPLLRCVPLYARSGVEARRRSQARRGEEREQRPSLQPRPREKAAEAVILRGCAWQGLMRGGCHCERDCGGGEMDVSAHATAAAIENPVDTIAQDPLGGRRTVVGSVDPDKAAATDAGGRRCRGHSVARDGGGRRCRGRGLRTRPAGASGGAGPPQRTTRRLDRGVRSLRGRGRAGRPLGMPLRTTPRGERSSSCLRPAVARPVAASTRPQPWSHDRPQH